MEDLRRKFAGNQNMYPALNNFERQGPSGPSVISISSQDDSPVAPQPKQKRYEVIISSDEENDPVIVPRSQPTHALHKERLEPLIIRTGNAITQKAHQVLDKFKDRHGHGNPIPIPSNNVRPPPPFNHYQAPKPQEDQNPTWTAFGVDDHLYDPRKSAAEAEKDLRNLMEGNFNDDKETVIDMELAKVKGFRDGILLLPHQVLGRVWMADREDGKKLGGILADDMGLGKTIQTLTRIVDGRPKKADKEDGWAAPTLVVCPVALVGQWASEIKKMAVGLTVIEHHGPNRTTSPDALKRAHVVITSYSIVSSEHAAFKPPSKDEGSSATAKAKAKSKAKANVSGSDSFIDDSDDSAEHFGRTIGKNKAAGKTKRAEKDALFRVRWWRIVLDEAHTIKNRNTKSALACCDLVAKYRWCLTGTPMQNSVEELYSLIKFLQIRPLNEWTTFNEQIAKPVKNGRSVRAMKRLQVVLKSIMLRRRKDHILNGEPIIKLPARIVKIVECEFNTSEKAFYHAIETKMADSLDKIMESENKAIYTSVLVLLLRLRQACDHPGLIAADYKDDKEAFEPTPAKNPDGGDDGDDLAHMFGQLEVGAVKCQVCQVPLNDTNTSEDSRVHCEGCAPFAIQAKSMNKSSDLPPDSAKIRMLLKLLRDVEERGEGEKTIVFSQFTSMLDLIQPFLKAEGIKYVRYDGSMKKDDREKALTTIRESKSRRVILISFKAGSTGLNLTACNNVILVDLWWNPALEDQAFDRAHRFGQQRDVNIFKLTIAGTVEQRILELQEKKRALTAAALSGDKLKNMRLGMEDLLALFRHGGKDDDEED